MAGHVGTKSRTVSKESVQNSLIPALGFTKLLWKHEASAGDRIINLTSLSAPASSVANGYVAPSVSILSQVNLQQFKENFTLKSGAGEWVIYDDFVISGANQIVLLKDAEEGEIFTGLIDFEAITGTTLADDHPFSVSGTLAAGTTDFNVGQTFPVDQYLSSQHGALLIFKDGQLMHRNTNNQPSGAGIDGDYYEVHAGAGLGSIIRFNASDTEDAQISAISNGALVEKPSGTHTQLLETMQGQLNVVTAQVEENSGLTPGALSSTPATANLKAFGDRVLKNEQDIATKQDAFTQNWGEKVLASDVTSDGVIAALTFSGLVVGKTYRLGGAIYLEANTTDGTVTCLVDNGSQALGQYQSTQTGVAGTFNVNHALNTIFIATATTVTFTASSANANSKVGGNGSKRQTFVQLEELPNHVGGAF